MGTAPSIFGKRLRAMREEREITQEELGSKAQISAVMVSHFETGRRQSPSIENLIKLANAMEVSADYLLGRTDDKNPTASPLEAVFRSDDWAKTEERMQFLKHLTDVWSLEDTERSKKE